MIEVGKQLPSVYFSESRDFQLVGRLFEAILNYGKVGTDVLENIYNVNAMDDKLVNLLAMTVGFESKHEYDVHNLKVICGCFNDILKSKGTKVGIDKAISALLNAQGIDDDFSTEFIYDDRQVEVYIPSKTQDVTLLKDLFDYVLPIGWSYTIISAIGGDLTHYTTTIFSNSSVPSKSDMEANTSELDKVAKLSSDESEDKEGITGLGIIPKPEDIA